MVALPVAYLPRNNASGGGFHTHISVAFSWRTVNLFMQLAIGVEECEVDARSRAERGLIALRTHERGWGGLLKDIVVYADKSAAGVRVYILCGHIL